jgi:hypothetical protein
VKPAAVRRDCVDAQDDELGQGLPSRRRPGTAGVSLITADLLPDALQRVAARQAVPLARTLGLIPSCPDVSVRS